MTAEDKNLEDVLEEELDQLEIDKVETNSNNCFRTTLENNTLVDTFAMKEFGLAQTSTQPQQQEEDNNINMELTT